ncbi:hypothetical protein ANTRET_LOCUS8809 [Anthophora retusa]
MMKSWIDSEKRSTLSNDSWFSETLVTASDEENRRHFWSNDGDSKGEKSLPRRRASSRELSVFGYDQNSPGALHRNSPRRLEGRARGENLRKSSSRTCSRRQKAQMSGESFCSHTCADSGVPSPTRCHGFICAVTRKPEEEEL